VNVTDVNILKCRGLTQKSTKNTNTIAKNSESQVPAQKRIRLKPSKMIKRKLNSKGIEENE
jgi:hypothetical protein